MLRELPVLQIEDEVAQLIRRCAHRLPDDYLDALQAARSKEESSMGQEVIELLLDNAAYADQERIPTCQDTGMAIIYLDVGQDVHFVDGDLNEAIHRGVCSGYTQLRKSVVNDPLLRDNTGDNSPPIVHFQIVRGDRVTIRLLMKGFGAEMMSRLAMLPPSEGVQGVRRFVLDVVKQAGPNACPPLIVGVGLGSSFDGVAELAKRALLRPIGSTNPKEHLARLESELFDSINELGIGPQGLGGQTTALAVHIESFPTHIAALPVAVNLNCSAPRRAHVVL